MAVAARTRWSLAAVTTCVVFALVAVCRGDSMSNPSAAPEVAVAEFQAWVRAQGSGASSEAEGLQLALKRAEGLLQLVEEGRIETALEAMVNLTEPMKEGLSVAVRSVLEKVIDTQGDVDVLHCSPGPQSLPGHCSEGPVDNMVSFNGLHFSVAGVDLPTTTARNIPLHGYLLTVRSKSVFVKLSGHARCTASFELLDGVRMTECFVGSRRLLVRNPDQAHAEGSHERHLGSLNDPNHCIGNKTMAVFVLDWDDSSKNWVSKSTTAAAAKEDMRKQALKVLPVIKQYSFGRYQVNPYFHPTVYTIKFSAISGAGDVFTELKRVVAADADAGTTVEQWERVSVYFPPIPAFGWAGLASMPGTYSWFQSTGDALLAHEWGHNCGFAHANARGIEYKSPLDVMGGGAITDSYGVAYRQGAGWIDDNKITSLDPLASYPELASPGAAVNMAEVLVNAIDDPRATSSVDRQVAMRVNINVNNKNYVYADVRGGGPNAKGAQVYTGVYAGAIGPTELEDVGFSTPTLADAGVRPGSAYAYEGQSFSCCDQTRVDTVPYTAPRVVFQALDKVEVPNQPFALRMRAFFIDANGTRADGLGCVGATCERRFHETLQYMSIDSPVSVHQAAATNRFLFRAPLADPAQLGLFACASVAGVNVTAATYRPYRPPHDVALYGAHLLTGAVAGAAKVVAKCGVGEMTQIATVVSDASPEGLFFAVAANITGVQVSFRVSPLPGLACAKIKVNIPSMSYLTGVYEPHPIAPIVNGKPHYTMDNYANLFWKSNVNKWCITNNCWANNCGSFTCSGVNESPDSPFGLTTLGTRSTVTCACSAGAYENTDGSHTCAVCPIYHNSPISSYGPSSCTCSAGYQPAATGASKCEACPTNTYKSTLGNTACLPCPAGTGSAAGAQSADACVVQYVCPRFWLDSNDNNYDAMFAFKGFYKGRPWYEAETATVGNGKQSIYYDSVWYLSDKLAQNYNYKAWQSNAWTIEQLDADRSDLTVSCKCELNGIVEHGCSCLSGQIAVDGVCQPCGEGTYLSDASGTCTPCPALSTTSPNEDTRSTCSTVTCRTFRLTSADWYAGQYRYNGLSATGRLKYVLLSNTAFEFWSPPIPRDPWWLYKDGQTTSYYARGVAGAVYNLISGTQKYNAPSEWTWQCVDCEAGYALNADKTQCVPCGAGQTSEPGGVCICKPGMTMVDGACVRCGPGTAKVAAGGGACVACGEGLVPNLNHDACVCSTGRVLKGETCVLAEAQCPAGQAVASSTATSVSCADCPAGEYSIGAGCKRCPTGMQALDATKDVCTCQPGLIAYQDKGCFMPNELTVTGSQLQPIIAGKYTARASGGVIEYSSAATGLSFVRSSRMGGQWALVPSAADADKRVMYSVTNVTVPTLASGWRIFHPSSQWFVAESTVAVTGALNGVPVELSSGGGSTDTCAATASLTRTPLLMYKQHVVSTSCTLAKADCSKPDFVVEGMLFWIVSAVAPARVQAVTCADGGTVMMLDNK